MVDAVMAFPPEGTRVQILEPLVRGAKGRVTGRCWKEDSRRRGASCAFRVDGYVRK